VDVRRAIGSGRLRRLSAGLAAALLLGAAVAPGAEGPADGRPAVEGGRVEVVLAADYRKDLPAIIEEFAKAGLANVHVQFMRLGRPPTNLGLGREVTAERARAAIRMAVKYNGGVTVLLPASLFPPRFVTIASSNFDDTVECPIGAADLARLKDPALTTEQFHALYRDLTRPRDGRPARGGRR
jgi:hypothetical protein